MRYGNATLSRALRLHHRRRLRLDDGFDGLVLLILAPPHRSHNLGRPTAVRENKHALEAAVREA